MPKKIVAYRCGYCGNKFFLESSCIDHERLCEKRKLCKHRNVSSSGRSINGGESFRCKACGHQWETTGNSEFDDSRFLHGD